MDKKIRHKIMNKQRLTLDELSDLIIEPKNYKNLFGVDDNFMVTKIKGKYYRVKHSTLEYSRRPDYPVNTGLPAAGTIEEVYPHPIFCTIYTKAHPEFHSGSFGNDYFFSGDFPDCVELDKMKEGDLKKLRSVIDTELERRATAIIEEKKLKKQQLKIAKKEERRIKLKRFKTRWKRRLGIGTKKTK